jgi:predicted aspartyl protease
VNGRGPFTFLYDTGGSYLTVGSKVAKAAGAKVVIDRGGHRDVVALNTLRIGGVEIRNVWAILDDSWGVDGVLGFPTLGDMSVLFDFARREILVSRNRIPMPRSFTLRYEDPFNVPTVPVGIGGKNVPILIDTGDDAYGLEIRSSELSDAAVDHPPVAAGTVMNGARQQSTAITTLRDAVTLGPTRALRAQIAINDDLSVGDLGYDALKQFRFQIEPKQRAVTFQPRFAGGEFRLTTSGLRAK